MGPAPRLASRQIWARHTLSEANDTVRRTMAALNTALSAQTHVRLALGSSAQAAAAVAEAADREAVAADRAADMANIVHTIRHALAGAHAVAQRASDVVAAVERSERNGAAFMLPSAVADCGADSGEVENSAMVVVDELIALLTRVKL